MFIRVVAVIVVLSVSILSRCDEEPGRFQNCEVSPPAIPKELLEILPSGAKLIGINQGDSVPGQYFVRFKLSAEINTIVRLQMMFSHDKIARSILPNTPEASKRLAAAMTKKYGGNVLGMYEENLRLCPPEQNGFITEDISDANIRKLADDPRIEDVQPNFIYHLARTSEVSRGSASH